MIGHVLVNCPKQVLPGFVHVLPGLSSKRLLARICKSAVVVLKNTEVFIDFVQVVQLDFKFLIVMRPQILLKVYLTLENLVARQLAIQKPNDLVLLRLDTRARLVEDRYGALKVTARSGGVATDGELEF